VLIHMRLFPNMFDLARQVQVTAVTLRTAPRVKKPAMTGLQSPPVATRKGQGGIAADKRVAMALLRQLPVPVTRCIDPPRVRVARTFDGTRGIAIRKPPTFNERQACQPPFSFR
jgi:hypothetical protein